MGTWHRKARGAICAIALLLAAQGSFAASVVERDVDGDGRAEFVLENQALRVVIAPHFGAQAVSVFRKDLGVECVPDGGKEGGFFSDHDLRQGWPGEFFGASYDVAVLNDSTREPSVRCTCVAAGKWHQQQEPSLAGLRIERDIALVGEKPLIRLRVRFVNETDEGKLVHYWLQNVCSAAGNVERDRFFRPGPEAFAPLAGDTSDWLYTPTGGWTARCDPEEHAAIVWLMDYNYLKTLYNCIPRTTEWMYDPVPIPAGQTWETTVWTAFCTGLDAVTHASESLIADSRIVLEKKGVALVHRVAAGPLGPPSVRLSATLTNRGTGKGVRFEFSTTLARIVPIQDRSAWKAFPMPPVEIKDLAARAVLAEQRLPEPPGRGLLVADIAATAGEEKEAFQVSAVSGQSKLSFVRKPPAKKKTYLKPGKIELRRDEVLDALLVVEPSFRERWRLEQIIKTIDPNAKVRVAELSFAVWKGTAELSNLPTSYDEMLSYDVVVLQAGDMLALGDFVREMLTDYLSAGGGLVMLGGYFSYGKGRYPQCALTELIPVEPAGPFDLKRAAYPAVVKREEHVALNGCAWEQAPLVPYYHRVVSKPGYSPSLTVDGSPLLVAARMPAGGRIAAFTGTVLGEAREGTEFWKWKDYERFMGNLVRWAAERGPAVEGAVSVGPNLLQNPGFEHGVAHWTENTSYEPMTALSSDAHGGKKSLFIRPAKAVRTKEQEGVSGAIYQGVPFDPGKKYRFSLWARGGGRFNFYVYQYDNKTFVGSAASLPFRLTDKWQDYAFEYVAPNPRVAKISLAIHIDEGSAAYIDDVEARAIGNE